MRDAYEVYDGFIVQKFLQERVSSRRGQVTGLTWEDVARVCGFAEGSGSIAGLRDSAIKIKQKIGYTVLVRLIRQSVVQLNSIDTL